MALLACEVILLVLCFLYARAIILEQIFFLALALFAVLVLSDLLLTWTLILAFGFWTYRFGCGCGLYPDHSTGLFINQFSSFDWDST